MPHTKLLIHAVWATKNRKPLLNKSQMNLLKKHMKEYAQTKNIYLLNVNGWLDHVHCLISLEPEQILSNVINLLKGESSFWINKNKICTEKFSWQNEYFAVSIGQSQFEAINNYINGQEIHHKKKSFEQEYDEFFEAYAFEKEKA
ncbi:MAG: transposase [Bacteroidetes bacterium B1(2017)]|nr:MAG: transposase [Bacteroidetes bacterium B1(2017)]